MHSKYIKLLNETYIELLKLNIYLNTSIKKERTYNNSIYPQYEHKEYIKPRMRNPKRASN